MRKVKVITFPVGEAAAAAVRRQLADTTACLGRWAEEVRRGTGQDAAHTFARCLRESPASFDVLVRTSPADAVRVVWQATAAGAGLLFVAEPDGLRTVNLILAGAAPEADEAATRQAALLLTPVQPYAGCFDTIKASPRPLVATFCDHAGGLTRAVDIAVLAFTAVFLSLLG